MVLTAELFQEEELCEELQPYVRELGVEEDGMLALHHPLLIHVPYHKMMNCFINKQFEHKKSAIKNAYNSCDWLKYLFLHERPYRFEVFNQILAAGVPLTEEQYWALTGAIWVDSENIHENLEEWIDVWESDIPLRVDFVMDEKEVKALSKLDDLVTIYRGATHVYVGDGLSWTTDYEIAKWFANRFSRGERYIASGLVHKKHIYAYFTRRGEAEVITNPINVIDFKVEKIR